MSLDRVRVLVEVYVGYWGGRFVVSIVAFIRWNEPDRKLGKEDVLRKASN